MSGTAGVERRDDARRARRVMLLIITVPAAWTLLELAWAATGQPRAPLRPGEAMMAVSAAHQAPGPNGWPLLVEAGVRARKIDAEARRRYQRSETEVVGVRPRYELLRGPAIDESALTCELAAIGAMREAGVFARLVEAAGAPRFVRPMPDEGSIYEMSLPELSDFRLLARACLASMRHALLRDDGPAAVAAFEQSLAITRASSAQPLLIDRLVTVAIGRMVIEELRTLIADGRLDEATARAMLAAMDRQLPLAPITLTMAGERLAVLAVIDECFTDDGHGGGRLRPAAVAGIASGGFAGTLPIGGGLAYALQADRAETASLLEELFTALEAEAALSPADRANLPADASAAFLARLTWRHGLIRMLAPVAARVYAPNDDLVMLLEGGRVMLAIEAFRAARGRLPATLDELVPGFLDEVPLDPASGAPFVYRLLDAGRSYELSSIGVDGVDDVDDAMADDGPLRDERLETARSGQSVWDAGADFIFSESERDPR